MARATEAWDRGSRAPVPDAMPGNPGETARAGPRPLLWALAQVAGWEPGPVAAGEEAHPPRSR